MRTALFALLLTTAPALAASGPPAKPGQNYLAARQAMLKAGYTTASTANIRRGCPIGYLDECQAHEEMFDCSGTGLAGCKFVFWKDDQPVLVQTQGEEIAQQKVTRVSVMSVAEQKQLFLNR